MAEYVIRHGPDLLGATVYRQPGAHFVCWCRTPLLASRIVAGLREVDLAEARDTEPPGAPERETTVVELPLPPHAPRASALDHADVLAVLEGKP